MSWRDLKEVAREFLQKYNDRGQEVPDQTPVEVPFKWRRPMDIHEMIARALQSHEIQKKWSEEGLESWDEANDFEVEDGEPEFNSPYELHEMQEEWYNTDRRNGAANRRKDAAGRDVERPEEDEKGFSSAEGAGGREKESGGAGGRADGRVEGRDRKVGKAVEPE